MLWLYMNMQHEMIHAYLYVTRDKDWTGHGPSFLNLSQYVLSLPTAATMQ